MPEGEPAHVSELTQRLFAYNPQLAARLSHLARDEFIHAELLAAITPSKAWQETRDFIEQVIEQKTPVLLFGDYDVDGSTAAFLLFRWMRNRGAVGNIFLPSRFRHGYGLDTSVLDQARDQGYKALIALDCGTANIEEISAAREMGMDVLVVDHHSPKEQLPDCTVLNPHLLEALPPLCTAGLVLLLIQVISEGSPELLEGDELELAGLATLADIVPLVPENWYLIHQALRLLPESRNVGAQELLKISQLHGIDTLTARQLAFQMIPRLNAAGRMRSAKLISDLFASPGKDAARMQAAQLDLLNRERKDVTDENFRQAARQALNFADDPVLVLYDEQWHIGVVGIVAARIAEQFCKPALVLTNSPVEADMLTGSARSYGNVSLVESLGACSDELESFGGHAAAAGAKLRPWKLDELRSAWGVAVSQMHADPDNIASSEVIEDWSGLPGLRIDELSAGLEDDLWKLAPFDREILQAPRCRLLGAHVARCTFMGRERTHINLLLTDGERQVRIAGFNMSHLQPLLKQGLEVEAVVELEPDNWNNKRSVMLRLIGLIKQDGSQVS